MLYLNRTTKSITVLALIAGPTLCFFQNCSNHGFNSNAGLSSTATSDGFSDAMVIEPPFYAEKNNDIQINDPAMEKSMKGFIASCDQIAISDILLQIESITDSAGQKKFEIIDADKSISLDKLNLKLKSLKQQSLEEIVLHLKSDGNKVLSTDNVAMDLQSAGAQGTTITIKLNQAQEINSDQVYNLELSINLQEQIAISKTRCLFKPLVREATLSLL